MRKVVLTRLETGNEGTFGDLVTDFGFHCKSGELPWRNNQIGKSCIPAGVYLCIWADSGKHGFCYHVKDVQGRSDILFHVANYFGDVDKNMKSDVLGCIGLGEHMGILGTQKALLNSKKTMTVFEAGMNKESFELAIQWGFKHDAVSTDMA